MHSIAFFLMIWDGEICLKWL
uniref:Uncharacterized protein n=1 Tax=Arundo donax TaxID=35708 RepID=A0A0A9CW82_ARUDO